MSVKPDALGYAVCLDARGFAAEAAELRRLHKVEIQRDALRVAAVEFIRKVESGEARSVRSYAQFKQALAESEDVNS